MTSKSESISASLDELRAQYVHLTRSVLPQMARSERRDWPIQADHCFQRVVLDTVCGGVWYDHLERPAYKNLTHDQAAQAVALCQAMRDGLADVAQLNKQSLMWRGKWRGPAGDSAREM